MKYRHIYPSLITAFLATNASAALSWTGGGDSISLYQEANWQEDDGSALEANEINGNALVAADTGGEIRIETGSGSPSNFSGDFLIGANHLIISNKTLRSVAATTDIIGTTGAALTINSGGVLSLAGTISGFNGSGNINVSGGSLTSTGEINVSGSALNVTNGGTVETDGIRIAGVSTWDSGSVTLNDVNPFRTGGVVSSSNSFNITAGAGDFTLTHTDLTGGYVNRDIAGKLYTGFFSLDGVNVDPDGTGFVGSGTGGALASEADVVALNAFIKANYTIGGRYLELSDNTGGERTLSVIAVPEPSSTALLGLGGLALILRRRK